MHTDNEDHKTFQLDIYNDFKIAIRNMNLDKVKDYVQKYQHEFDLINRLDPQSRQISTFIAASISDDKEAYDMTTYLIE